MNVAQNISGEENSINQRRNALLVIALPKGSGTIHGIAEEIIVASATDSRDEYIFFT